MKFQHAHFFDSTNTHSENDTVFQNDFDHQNEFGESYIRLREKEGRLLTDPEVTKLPLITDSQFTHEWAVRKNSSENLIQHLSQFNRPLKILEVGSGNGWLSFTIGKALSNSVVVGIDVNKTEVLQATRLFANDRTVFILGDILTFPFLTTFDVIIVAATIQYFSDARGLIRRLRNLLQHNGEIHLLDSPIYQSAEVPAAQSRSRQYFTRLGFPQLANFYYHHVWQIFDEVNVEVKYNPRGTAWRRIKHMLMKKISSSSPFPWIIIKRK